MCVCKYVCVSVCVNVWKIEERDIKISDAPALSSLLAPAAHSRGGEAGDRWGGAVYVWA